MTKRRYPRLCSFIKVLDVLTDERKAVCREESDQTVLWFHTYAICRHTGLHHETVRSVLDVLNGCGYVDLSELGPVGCKTRTRVLWVRVTRPDRLSMLASLLSCLLPSGS